MPPSKSKIGIRLCWFLVASLVVAWGFSLFNGPLVVFGNKHRLTFQLADGIIAASWPSGSQATTSNSSIHFHDTYYIKPHGFVGPRTFGLVLPAFSSTLPIFTPGLSFVFVPLWLPMLLVLIAPVVSIIRRRRRIPPGNCQRCRYDLTGNTSGVCPECGLAVAQPRSLHAAPVAGGLPP